MSSDPLHTTTTAMPQDNSYSVSVNPPRRAKQNSFRTLLPQPASPLSTDASEFEPTTVSGPAKRGRKPGPLSRAARESQRKLNHSIIEKARRTKINDALTSLKHLVPPGYGHQPSQAEDEEGKKKKGKKEEKDKEFKLEILERTVVFLKDLLKHVEVLEANVSSSANTPALCTKCSSTLTPDPNPIQRSLEENSSLKRKRSLSFHSSFNNVNAEFSYKRRCPRTSPRLPLPPISSWLHNPDSVSVPFTARQMDPQMDPPLLNPLSHTSPSENATADLLSPDSNTSMTMGLPSPPTSTRFLPQQHPLPSSYVPTLHLGASASASESASQNSSGLLTSFANGSLGASSYSRSTPTESASHHTLQSLLSPTPEDESAASLLLQISTGGVETSATLADVDTSRTLLSVGTRSRNVQAQTPGSMLGLVQVRRS